MNIKSDSLNTFLSNNVAQDINLSDYSSIKITDNSLWENYSVIAQVYDPQKFSNVEVSNDLIQSFDIETARGDWKVYERVDNISYGSNNLPISLSLITYDIADNTFTQDISNITYKQSHDFYRQDELLKVCESNIGVNGKYGFGILAIAFADVSQPARNLPDSFNLRAADPQGNITDISFTNIDWSKDRVIGFDAVVNSHSSIGIEQLEESAVSYSVSSIFQDNGKLLGINVEVNTEAETNSYSWTTQDNISLKEFSEKISKGVNPLDIMGSSRIQLGEAKQALLSVNYDSTGYLDNAVKTYEIDYGITNSNSLENQMRKDLFELSQTDNQTVLNVVWNQDITAMNKKDLSRTIDIIRDDIQTKLGDYIGQREINTLDGQNIALNESLSFKLNDNNRIMSQNVIKTETGNAIKDVVFILQPEGLKCVSFKQETADVVQNTYDAKYFKEPSVSKEKTFIDKTRDTIKDFIRNSPNIQKGINSIKNLFIFEKDQNENINNQTKTDMQDKMYDFKNAIFDKNALPKAMTKLTEEKQSYYKGNQVWLNKEKTEAFSKVLGIGKEEFKGRDNILVSQEGNQYFASIRKAVQPQISNVKSFEIKKEQYEKITEHALPINKGNTWCNFLVREVASHFNVSDSFVNPKQSETANIMADKLANGSYNTDTGRFRSVGYDKAQAYAGHGGFAIVAYRAERGNGHLAVVTGGYNGAANIKRINIFQTNGIDEIGKNRFGAMHLSKA
ncbi:hypothetical protein ACFL4O_03255, partial [bacterium]